MLTERQRKHLRGLAHALAPVVLLGQDGLTPGVVTEARLALEAHELIKVKVRGAKREERDVILGLLASETGSTLIHQVGHVGVLYRRHHELPRIVIPDP